MPLPRLWQVSLHRGLSPPGARAFVRPGGRAAARPEGPLLRFRPSPLRSQVPAARVREPAEGSGQSGGVGRREA